MVPTLILRWTTVLAFDPAFGVLYMIIGVLSVTVVGRAIGQRVGAERLSRIAGDRIERIRARLGRTGVVGVAALRQVPLGPFMIVNAVAGAARVRRNVFVAGTLLGMLPSIVVMVIAGSSLRAWLLG